MADRTIDPGMVAQRLAQRCCRRALPGRQDGKSDAWHRERALAVTSGVPTYTIPSCRYCMGCYQLGTLSLHTCVFADFTDASLRSVDLTSAAWTRSRVQRAKYGLVKGGSAGAPLLPVGRSPLTPGFLRRKDRVNS